MLNTQYRLSLLYPPTPPPTLTLPPVQRYQAPNEAQSRQPAAMRHNDKQASEGQQFWWQNTKKEGKQGSSRYPARTTPKTMFFFKGFKLMRFFYRFFLTVRTLHRIFFYNVQKFTIILFFFSYFFFDIFLLCFDCVFYRSLLKLIFLYKNQVISSSLMPSPLHSGLSSPTLYDTFYQWKTHSQTHTDSAFRCVQSQFLSICTGKRFNQKLITQS